VHYNLYNAYSIGKLQKKLTKFKNK